MTISERMFFIMKDAGISQAELSKRTGISTRTISDWNMKKTNPGADKIMIICEALNITPEELLTGTDGEMGQSKEVTESKNRIDLISEKRLIEVYRNLPDDMRRRIFAYIEMLQNTKKVRE